MANPFRRRKEPGAEGSKPVWKVDKAESIAGAARELEGESTREPGEGKLVYIDEQGERRHLPADLSQLSTGERDAAIAAMSSALGADPDYAKIAAIERLTELHASGAISEENFQREKRRLEGFGR